MSFTNFLYLSPSLFLCVKSLLCSLSLSPLFLFFFSLSFSQSISLLCQSMELLAVSSVSSSSLLSVFFDSYAARKSILNRYQLYWENISYQPLIGTDTPPKCIEKKYQVVLAYFSCIGLYRLGLAFRPVQ